MLDLWLIHLAGASWCTPHSEPLRATLCCFPHLKISSFGIDFTIHGPAAGRMAAAALTQPVCPPPFPPSLVCTHERAGPASSGHQEGGNDDQQQL